MALKEAQKAQSEDEVPIGCVIVHNGTVISKAHNKTLSGMRGFFISISY